MFLDSTRDPSDIDFNPTLFSAIYQYLSNPISYNQQQDGSGSLVSKIQSLNFAGEYNQWKKVSLGLEMPLYQLDYHQQKTQFAFGDMRVFSKIKLLEADSDHHFKISLVPSVYLPTGNQALLLSNPHGGAGGNLVVEKTSGNTLFAANLGVDSFPGASYNNVNYDLQFYSGLGLKYDFSKKWSTEIEWLGRQIYSVQTGDLYAGEQYHFSSHGAVMFGASLASTDFDESNLEYRIMLGLRWTPSSTKVITEKVLTKVETIQKIKTVHDCGPKAYAQKFLARELTEEEKKYFRKNNLLPYKSTQDHLIETLRLGGKNGFTAEGISYVKDAQILFAIDLVDLPARDTVISIEALDLSIAVNKRWTKDEKKTDMICLLKEKICSGDLYNQPSMAKNINSSFFMGKEPPNDFFTRQITDPHKITMLSDEISTIKVKLPLSRLIENSVLSDLTQLLYDNSRGSQNQHSKTLYFAVAHDVYVVKTSVRLNVELSAESCADSNPPPTTETREEEPKIETNEVIHDEN